MLNFSIFLIDDYISDLLDNINIDQDDEDLFTEEFI